MKHQHGLLGLISSPFSSAMSGLQGMSQCEDLNSKLPSGSIINSSYVTVDGLSVNGVNNTIPFCRVFATTHYGLNDSVVYQVWLPDTPQYNGRYLSVGKYSRLLPMICSVVCLICRVLTKL